MAKVNPDLIALLKEWRGNRSQARAAKDLGVSQALWSGWEKGEKEISTDYLIQLGNASQYPASLHFWVAAGVPSSVLAMEGPIPLKIARESGVALPRGTTLVRLLETEIGAGYEIDFYNSLETSLVVPESWVPHPNDTHCIRVREEGLAPTIPSGSILGVDITYLNAESLEGQFVVAQRPGNGAIARKFMRFGTLWALIPLNSQCETFSYTGENWKIIGRIVFWLSRPKGSMIPGNKRASKQIRISKKFSAERLLECSQKGESEIFDGEWSEI